MKYTSAGGIISGISSAGFKADRKKEGRLL